MPTRPALPEHPLADLEAWLQSFIVDPAQDEIVDAREATAAEQYIKPSHTLSSLERANVYRGQYLMRMEEALSSDYPGLKHFLGDHEFWRFVETYVQVFPSRSYNLSRLSDHVPDFCAKTTLFKRPAFLYDMARLEHAITTAFDAAYSPILKQADAAAVPEEAWGGARIHVVASMRLLALNYPVNAYLNALKAEEKPPSMARAPNWVVVWRNEYSMWRLPIAQPHYQLLKDLSDGLTLGQAIMRATQGKLRMDPQEVFNFIARCVSEGMFSRIELTPRP